MEIAKSRPKVTVGNEPPVHVHEDSRITDVSEALEVANELVSESKEQGQWGELYGSIVVLGDLQTTEVSLENGESINDYPVEL